MKIDFFRGELTDVFAQTATLSNTAGGRGVVTGGVSAAPA